jgi:hypothetical protein
MSTFDSINEYTIEPSVAAIEELKNSWSWLLGEHWEPFLYSAIGDVFFRVPAGAIWWLSTATGDLEQVAQSRSEFIELLEGESFDEWFLPGLIMYTKSLGKTLQKGECYSFHTLPVFEQGSFCAENMFVVEASLHFSTSGEVIRQLRSLKDGAEVKIIINT